MTYSQTNHVLADVLHESWDVITPLSRCFSLVISKQEILYPDISRWRFKFDSTNELLSVFPVRIYASSKRLSDMTALMEEENLSGKADINEVPDSFGQYNLYLYLLTESGKPCYDIFALEHIIGIVPKPEVTDI